MDITNKFKIGMAWDNCDLFAINNNDGTYYIDKNRRGVSKNTVSKAQYKEILMHSENPIVINRLAYC